MPLRAFLPPPANSAQHPRITREEVPAYDTESWTERVSCDGVIVVEDLKEEFSGEFSNRREDEFELGEFVLDECELGRRRGRGGLGE
jgi:hypothetical protein